MRLLAADALGSECSLFFQYLAFPSEIEAMLRWECRKHAYRDDEMGHIAILCYDLEPRNGVTISYDVIEYTWTVLLDPFPYKSSIVSNIIRTYQGSSYGRADPLVSSALDAEAMKDALMCDKP